jgi:hypothetical protein
MPQLGGKADPDRPPKPLGNHDADVTPAWQEICYNIDLTILAI